MNEKNYGKLKSAAIIIILILIDQFTKFIAVKNQIDLGFFKITYVENSGMILGLLSNYTFLVYLITLGAIIFLIYNRKEFSTSPLSYELIMAGILANTLDRILHGHVIDFLQIGSFPVFNLADSLIVIGVGIFTLYNLKEFKSK